MSKTKKNIKNLLDEIRKKKRRVIKKKKNNNKSGGGAKHKKKKSKLSTIILAAKKKIKNGASAQNVIESALESARIAMKKAGGKKNIIIPRVLPISSKVGGYLPFLIPLFSGLSAVGALAGGASGIVKAINDMKYAQRDFIEKERHNKAMEAAAIGRGLYLKPYKEGMGIYHKPLYRRMSRRKTRRKICYRRKTSFRFDTKKNVFHDLTRRKTSKK